MNKAKALTVAAIMAAAMVTFLSAADTAREQTLQKGIDLMESKGDLAKAVPLFEEAAHSSDRGVAARALLYLGQAQERQGTEKARATYERIVREFSNQKESAATAQQRLTVLGGARSSGVLAKRLVCPGCGDNEADLSPDGRLMVFTDWDNGDIGIRDLSTGTVKRLFLKTGTWTDNEAYGETPVLSHDSRQIAYLWEPGSKDSRDQLRVIQNEPGARPRVLIDSPENAYYELAGWFPDNKSVLVLLDKADRTQQLGRVSVSDGATRVLRSLEWRRYRTAASPKLSPDGQYIVYSALAANPSLLPPAATDPGDQHIYILAADGSTESEVVKTAGINKNPVWTPDGKHILFTSDRSGKFDLWSIAVQNGKVAGPALLVSPEIGNVAAIGMHGGSYYYTTSGTGAEYVNIAEFTPRGDGQSRITRPTESFVGIRTAWSPDGKSISFKRHHPGSVNDFDLVVRSLETGEERAYVTNLGTSGDGPGSWFHDGKAITIAIGPGDGSRMSQRVDLKTGEFRALPAPSAVGPAALSLDDKTVYVSRNDEKDWAKLPAHVVAVDMSTGQEKKVFTMPEPGYAYFLLLTPDGRTLVGRRQDPKTHTMHLCRLNVDGTGYREIYTLSQSDFNDNFALTQDGRWILLAKRHGDNWELIRIPIEGGAPESTGVQLDSTPYRRSLALSPDGSRIAFTTVKRTEELWALDNVLSAVK